MKYIDPRINCVKSRGKTGHAIKTIQTEKTDLFNNFVLDARIESYVTATTTVSHILPGKRAKYENIRTILSTNFSGRLNPTGTGGTKAGGREGRTDGRVLPDRSLRADTCGPVR